MMKIFLSILFALLLVLVFSSPVSAQDPPEAEEVNVSVVGDAEVDISVVGDAAVEMAVVGAAEFGVVVDGDAAAFGIDIEGDQSEIGVAITGEDSQVKINGLVPFVTYQASGSRWARDQIKDNILPWMTEHENFFALTADGLTSALLLAQSNEADLKANEEVDQAYGDRLASLKSEVNSLDSESEDLAIRINTLEVESRLMHDYLERQIEQNYSNQVAYLNQMAFYNRVMVMVIATLGAMAFGFWMRARVRK